LPCKAGQFYSADRSRLFMNIINRLCLIIAVALTVDAFIIAPAFPQQSELAALNARVIALYRAGKFAEAVPLAQQALAINERALGPNHPDVAASLSTLAWLYDRQGRYAEAEPLHNRALMTADPKLGRAAALRNAILTYMNDKSSSLNAYPAFWAPFSIIGEGAAR
jgi:tetratricopeptide (TPR) repeat protein